MLRMPSTTNASDDHPAPRRIRRAWWIAGVVLVLLAAAAFPVLEDLVLRSSDDSERLAPGVTHRVERGPLVVSVIERGRLRSSNNVEIRCRVRGENTITWVVESGTVVEPGEVLLRLDTLVIEEEIAERTKYAHLARAQVARLEAEMKRAQLAISEYAQGRFVSELATLEKDLAIAESNLRAARNMRDYAVMMAKSGYVNDLEVEEKTSYVNQSQLAVELKKKEIEVLKKYTKEEELARLQGEYRAAKAEYEAEKERAMADEHRLQRALEEFENCVIKAERGGMVVYPSNREWEEAPRIEEGATVHKDQVLLLMPDLQHMEVKVGIHESIRDEVQPGMTAVVRLPKKTVQGEVTFVSPAARPAGWWTGNVVKYDTVVRLPEGEEGLIPGMTAEVEIILARVDDAVLVPTSAVVETADGYACWVNQEGRAVRRAITIGQANDLLVAVESGVRAGEEVVLNPMTHVREAQQEAAAAFDLDRKRAQDRRRRSEPAGRRQERRGA